MSPVSHLKSAIAAHRARLQPWTRRVRVHTPAGTALLVSVDDVLIAIADDGSEVEFDVTHSAELVDAVASNAPEAEAHLLDAWFWPVTWWTLRRRRARDWLLQMGVEVDNVVHFSLPLGQYTAIHVNAQWLWAPGHLGTSSRHFTLSQDDMLEWLGKALDATTAGDDLYWSWLIPWYDDFRERTSSWTPNAERSERLLAELERYNHTDEPETEWPGWEGW